jgi:hypothetical protein
MFFFLVYEPPDSTSHLLVMTSGVNWTYQMPPPEELEVISSAMQMHFSSWRNKNKDKLLHSLFLALSGPGTGKSRMLQEFPLILRTALSQKNEKSNENAKVVFEKLQGAYVFNVGFENGTTYGGELLRNADEEIGTRMRFQMTSKIGWDQFCLQYPCTIGDAIRDLAKCTGKKEEDLTVIICVDGVQKLQKAETSKFNQCFATLSQYINASPSFVIAIAAATTTGPTRAALSDSTQRRVYLSVPTVDAYKLSLFQQHPPSIRVQHMIADMGGHGRALEILTDILMENGYPKLKEPLSDIYQKVVTNFKSVYSDVEFISNLKDVIKDALLGTSLSSDRASEYERTVIIHGLSKIIHRSLDDYRISVPLIWMQMLISSDKEKGFDTLKLLSHSNFYDPANSNSNEPIQWQDFELFNLNVLKLKSEVFSNQEKSSIPISALHRGAKWGDGTMTDLIKVAELKVQKSVHRIETGSLNISNEVQCNFGNIVPANGSDVILNAPGAPGGDSFCCRKTSNGDIFLETHQYKLKKAVLSQADYDAEKLKAVSTNSTHSLFLLITSSDSKVSNLPSNCGLVDKSRFDDYFGPYAGRALRLYQDVFVNVASFRSLQSVPRIGRVRAKSIVEHRPFSDAEDCHARTGIPLSVAMSLRFDEW